MDRFFHGNRTWRPGFDTWVILGLLLVFLASRRFLFTGFPFSLSFLDQGMQMLDPVALKGDLLHSLLYQHTQPPLFNAFVGLVLKLAGSRVEALAVFRTLYLLMGFFLVVGIYYLSRGLGATRGWALAAATLFVFWPPNTWEHLFLHPPSERWLSYDYPAAVLLMAMALTLVQLRSTGRASYAVLFCLTCSALALTRSMFHLFFWVLPVITYVTCYVFSRRGANRRALVLAALLTVLLAAFPSARNARLTGWFTQSTFQGMNLASRTLFVPRGQVEAMISEGQISPLARVPRFSIPEIYLDYYGESRKTGIGILDDPRKSNNQPNFNHFIIVRASRETQRNTLVMALAHPGAVFKAMINGTYIFFGFQPSQYLWELNSPPWGFWDVDFPPPDLSSKAWPLRYVFGPALFAAVYFGVLVFLIRRRRDPVCLFMGFSLSYVFIISALLELGNNCIFRKQTDPLLFAGAALSATALWRMWILARDARARGNGPQNV